MIVATMPPFCVGQGKEFARYLTEEEELTAALNYPNELLPVGHIVPNHGVVAEFLRCKSAAVGGRGAIPPEGEASSVAVCAVQRRPRHAGRSQHS
jgi:hypothetical protein